MLALYIDLIEQTSRTWKPLPPPTFVKSASLVTRERSKCAELATLGHRLCVPLQRALSFSQDGFYTTSQIKIPCSGERGPRRIERADREFAPRQGAPLVAIHHRKPNSEIGQDRRGFIRTSQRRNSFRNSSGMSASKPMVRAKRLRIFNLVVTPAVDRYLSTLWARVSRSWRARRMRLRSICAAAMQVANSCCSWLAPSPAIFRAKASTSAESATSPNFASRAPRHHRTLRSTTAAAYGQVTRCFDFLHDFVQIAACWLLPRRESLEALLTSAPSSFQ